MTSRTIALIAMIALLPLAPRMAAGQDAAPPAGQPAATLQAARLTGDIRIDGRLDDAAWALATPGTGFTESWPNPGAQPSDATEVRVLWDDQALYVGVRAYDSSPDQIAAPLARRDAAGIYSDWIHVIIDSYHDRRSAFRFSVNPRGVQRDVYTYNDGNEDGSWDAVWEVATQIDSLGLDGRIPDPPLAAPLSRGDRGGACVGVPGDEGCGAAGAAPFLVAMGPSDAWLRVALR
jgi:hypothetical protein